jgi:antitoxin MazE
MGQLASVRIPVAIMQAAHLGIDEAVDVREESGGIAIEPVRAQRIRSGRTAEGD